MCADAKLYANKCKQSGGEKETKRLKMACTAARFLRFPISTFSTLLFSPSHFLLAPFCSQQKRKVMTNKNKCWPPVRVYMCGYLHSCEQKCVRVRCLFAMPRPSQPPTAHRPCVTKRSLLLVVAVGV